MSTTALLATNVNDLRDACHGASRLAGWWNNIKTGALDVSKTVMGWKLALVHTEVSEATEGIRKDKMDDHLPHRPAGEVELADAVIRIMDIAGALGYDIGGAIVEKMAYNARRPDHKPEARAAEGGKEF